MVLFFWFLVWTLVIYWCHRLGHHIPFVRWAHAGHHKFISNNPSPRWHWSNLFLFQDNFISTLDVWLTEFIPTMLFCWITGQWWIAIFFYFWSAFVQERIEHDPKFDYFPWFTSGKWHMMHHKNYRYNYGIFHPLWDILFKTYKYVK